MFRLRITLLSVFLSGIVLIAFGYLFLSLAAIMNLGRIDREIQALGESQLVVLHPREHWQHFESSLRAIYGDKNIDKLIVRVVAGRSINLYVSPNWPKPISVSSFPEFDLDLRPPPRPGPDGRLSGPTKRLVSPDYIKKPIFRTFHLPERDWRVGIMGNAYFIIIVGTDLSAYYKDAKAYGTLFMVAIPIALILLAAGGWIVAHRALAPVRMISQTAASITAKGLHKRIPRTGTTAEFRALIDVINDMLDRLATSFSQAARFSADAAHELQTPLTILQGLLDDAVRNATDGSEEQQRSNNLLEEVQRLKVIVQKLLVLSRADAGQLTLAKQRVDLSQLVAEIIEDITIIAPHLAIEHHLAQRITVTADPELLRQLVQNLGSNAIKYNADNGMIRFALKVEHDTAILDVINTGIPIPLEAQKRIFDRFYRADKSRNAKIPGAGLGLSLAKEIARAHHGRLAMRTDPEKGLIIFSLRLPVTM